MAEGVAGGDVVFVEVFVIDVISCGRFVSCVSPIEGKFGLGLPSV